jgi:NADPH:quinone reductase-like Zn-dependent oxidoreductase
MKAVVFQEHGGPEVLQVREVSRPTPGVGDVLVRLNYAALNHLDIWVRRGWPGIRLALPHIPGADGAGIVSLPGAGVVGFQPGDRVVINANLGCGTCEYCLAGWDNRCRDWNLLGETLPGTYAEYVTVPARQLLRVPDDFDLRPAAAAALVYHTAWHSLVRRAGLQPGEHVLIVGASGGVNTASIQIARLFHAQVYVVGSNTAKLELAKSLGAQVLIDRSKVDDWSREAFYRSGKRGMDIVVDNVGTTLPHSLRAARKGGRIVTVGNTAGPKVEIDNRYIFSKHLSLLGSTMGSLSDFHTVMGLVFAGQLQVALDQNYALEEAAAAHVRLETGEQLGKITLEIG